VSERTAGGDFVDLADLSRRVGLSTEQLEALAAAGAFDSLGVSRREAFWQAGEASKERADQLVGSAVSIQPPLLPVLSSTERLAYDIWSTGISPDDHPISQARASLTARGVSPISRLSDAESGRRVLAGGAVTHRQRPQTAGGIIFMNLEDETGMLNVIVSTGVWNRYRRLARESPALVVRGILERSPEGIINLVADRFEELALQTRTRSRDFR
jgi:error-prone DNA polymerase